MLKQQKCCVIKQEIETKYLPDELRSKEIDDFINGIL